MEWAGENVTIAEIERELARLRTELAEAEPTIRTSVMTHMAWVPEEWLEAAHGVLRGLAEQHPSRAILLVPDQAAKDGLDARVSLQTFPLGSVSGRSACTEEIELRLRGDRASAPASIVSPLLVSDLPVFLRWRGRPPFGAPELEQLAGVTDRLIVDSREWPDLPGARQELAALFERTAVSDIAWSRTLPWRAALAALWPGIGAVEELAVTGPAAEALLLAAWLRSRLGRPVSLAHTPAAELESVSADGRAVDRPGGELPAPSDLLSAELERYGRDRIYEEAVASM